MSEENTPTDPFEELKQMYPIFEFENKTRLPQRVMLAENDSKVVPVGGTLKLRSSMFINLPPVAAFKFKAPTLDDLRAVGLLKELPVKGNKQTPAASGKSKGAPSSESEA